MALTGTELQERIARIKELPAQLEALVSGLSQEQLDRHAGGEGWSIRQVVHHVADAHLNAFLRTKLILTEEKPILKPFDQEAWAELSDTTSLPMDPSLQMVKGIHARWAALLESLPESSWERAGVHLENGLMTLDDIVKTYSGHGQVHLDQIGRIKAGLGA